MDNITVLEKFTLCMLKEKMGFSTQAYRCHFVVGMLIEMYLEGTIDIENTNNGKLLNWDSRIKILIRDKEPKEEYNKILYNYIKESKDKDLSISDIMSKLCYTFSGKKLIELLDCIKEKMIADDLISIERKEGKIIKRDIIRVNEEKFMDVLDEVRREILRSEKLTDEMILLVSLLRYNYILNSMFNKFEKAILKEKRKEVEQMEICRYVSIARNLIESMDCSYM